MKKIGNEHWDLAAASWGEGRQRLWREHSDAVNRSLLVRWLPRKRSDYILKTDLFDEMCGEGLSSLLAARSERFLGMDISQITVRIACSRHADLRGIAADIRRLPFDDDTFDLIVSNSTLDHFEKHEIIAEGLAEIFRVLRPGGQLILTMDNRMNPVVALRNAIPSRLLKNMHLVPYYVGATWGPRKLRKELIRAGFRIDRLDSVLHCPRVFAVAAAFFMQKLASRRLQTIFLRGLSFFELLRHFPTRFLTGHFVAVSATQNANPETSKAAEHDSRVS